MSDTSNLFQSFSFTPAEGLRSTTYSPTQPESEAAIRNQIQGIADQLRDHVNALQNQLSAKTDGTDGAHYIGSAPISGVEGDTVAEQLRDLKLQLDNAMLSDIPDGAVDTSQLADGAVTAQKIATGAIGSQQLADGCITGEKLADSAGKLTQRIFITQSSSWTVPATGLYKITLYGGGGGGGAGMFLYNSNWTNPFQYFSGEGGSASAPISGEFMLWEGAQCQVIIGAGAAGRTSNTFTISNMTPTFTSVDASATVGGESLFLCEGFTLLETSTFYRIYGGAYKRSGRKTDSISINIYAGSSGGGLAEGESSAYLSSSNIGSDTVLSGAASCGGGNGAAYSYALVSAQNPSKGADAPGYGCGGGGGCMVFGVSSTSASSVVSAGGDGSDGIAIIEWVE